jgi:hypothetical protein
MGLSYEKPKVYGAKDMFIFWAKSMQKERPHLIIKHEKSTGKNTELWYEVREELNYLRAKNLQIDARIQELEKIDREVKYFTETSKEIFALRREIYDNKTEITKLEKLPGDYKKLILHYGQFKEILSTFNKLASERIIEGENLNLSNRLGYIQIRKIIPPTLKQQNIIDWKASKDYKQELIEKGLQPKDKAHPTGKNWLVYKLQPWYLRWAWVKKYNRACTVKNNTVYAFYPTADDAGKKADTVLGNKGKLAKAQALDPDLHLKYTTIDMRDVRKKQRERRESLKQAS